MSSPIRSSGSTPKPRPQRGSSVGKKSSKASHNIPQPKREIKVAVDDTEEKCKDNNPFDAPLNISTIPNINEANLWAGGDMNFSPTKMLKSTSSINELSDQTGTFYLKDNKEEPMILKSTLVVQEESRSPAPVPLNSRPLPEKIPFRELSSVEKAAARQK